MAVVVVVGDSDDNDDVDDEGDNDVVEVAATLCLACPNANSLLALCGEMEGLPYATL